MQRNKKILVLVAAVATVIILLAATSASAYRWHDKAYIKVIAHGPSGTLWGFQQHDKVTVSISDQGTPKRSETIVRTINWYEEWRNQCSISSSKSFYIDKPVTVKTTWGSKTKTARVSGRPTGSTKVIHVYF